jgi:hypothetical protein
MSSDPHNEASLASTELPTTARYVGEVVYFYAFDIAHELKRDPLPTLLGQPVAQFAMDASRRAPRQLLFYKPRMIHLPPLERIGPHGALRIQRTVKLLPIGAISIMIRVPFEVGRLGELVVFHDLIFADGALHDEVRRLARDVARELMPLCVKPHPQLQEEEAYTVFCFQGPLGAVPNGSSIAASWFERHRRDVAALLTCEAAAARLSAQEVHESTASHLSYYEDDLVVIDWDAALIIDDPAAFDETLYVMELANLQLTELEAYDRILDEALERAYRDLGRTPQRPRAVLRELRELRIDLERFRDEISNITKFLGDWHLARIYAAVALRFHLGDWHRTTDAKLKTLAELYQLLKSDESNRWMMILEATIVLLFVVDLIAIFSGAA